MDGTDLVAEIGQLRTGGTTDRPVRHQALVLLWAIGRARGHLPRMTQWSAAENELKDLLDTYSLPENKATPEYPFVALARRSALWELSELDVPPAHSSGARNWLIEHDPLGGLSEEAYQRFAEDETYVAVVSALMERFFPQEPIHALLTAVGLNGVPQSGTWELSAGDLIRRKELHNRFGGQQQGGISTPSANNLVLLFAGSTGERYGYQDGWTADGAFDYTGQGTEGDQVLHGVNAAIIDPQRRIHIFESTDRTILRYLGEFRPDDEQPYRREDGWDQFQQPRTVLVFRLRPITEVPGRCAVSVNVDQPKSTMVPFESNTATNYPVAPPSNETVAERREAKLVDHYRTWLAQHGHDSCRNMIQLPEHARPLYTDLFDMQRREVVEAKASSVRDNVRHALGQVLDYARYVDHQELAVLLPVRPAEDLISLLILHGVSCIYWSNGGFVRADVNGHTPTA